MTTTTEMTPGGCVRLCRGGTSLIFHPDDAEAISRTILNLVESGYTQHGEAATVPLKKGSPLVIRWQKDGSLRLSRVVRDREPWLSLTPGDAVDACLSMLELVGQ